MPAPSVLHTVVFGMIFGCRAAPGNPSRPHGQPGARRAANRRRNVRRRPAVFRVMVPSQDRDMTRIAKSLAVAALAAVGLCSIATAQAQTAYGCPAGFALIAGECSMVSAGEASATGERRQIADIPVVAPGTPSSIGKIMVG